MEQLYPLKFNTIFKDKIWGGNKIDTFLDKDFSPLPNCGETWEISGVEGNVSIVANGTLAGKPLTNLIEEYQESLLGKEIMKRFGAEFPLLIKFIDANQDLSIQVHPDDALAKKRHNCLGKTEMWYIMQADEGASLISGFNQPVTKETYLQHLQNGTLDQLLNREQVQKDDVFFIPAGRVHTIGKGCFLAEIQQSSDITYRIYDFDRTDAQGNKRELHTEQALDAIDYKHYDAYKTTYASALNQPIQIAACPYFQTNVLEYTKPLERDYSGFDSFVIFIGLEGQAQLQFAEGKLETIKKGEVVLLPATFKKVTLKTATSFKILETYVPLKS